MQAAVDRFEVDLPGMERAVNRMRIHERRPPFCRLRRFLFCRHGHDWTNFGSGLSCVTYCSRCWLD
jgi:hypothetical protein